MTGSFFVEKLILSAQWLPVRQWSQWKILTLSMLVLFLLVWLTRLQRSKKVRSKYKEQFQENSPVIGTSWGFHNKINHKSGNSTKGRIVPRNKGQKKPHEESKLPHYDTDTKKQTKECPMQQLSNSKAGNDKSHHKFTNYEKLNEEIKLLKNEINTHKQEKVSLEQQISKLTIDNEKLKRELTKLEKAESQIAEMTAAYKQLQAEKSSLEQIPEQQIAAKPTVETTDKKEPEKRTKTDNQHRTIDGVRQKLCRKCNEWKPESEFHKNSSSKDNLAVSCKICTNNAARERRRQKVTHS